MDLKTPCKNCPFANSPTRITFYNAERAEEIAESAYRNGFPCHLSAEYREDENGDGGYFAHEDGQHCIGSIMLFLNSGYDNWPGIGNRDLPDRVRERLWPNLALVFESEDDFIAANASVDTHPEGGDAVAAPFMGSAVGVAETPHTSPPSSPQAG